MAKAESSEVMIPDRSWIVAEELETLSQKLSSIVIAMEQTLRQPINDQYLAGLVGIVDDLSCDLDDLVDRLSRLTGPDREAAQARAEAAPA